MTLSARKNLENKLTPYLGLVCMTANETVRFRELTRTRLLRVSRQEQRILLKDIYAYNFLQLANAIQFCQKQKIQLYRFYSNTFPFSDTEIGEEELERLARKLKDLGNEAKELGIRVVSHPDQFVVLNSDRPEVIENSVRILKIHAKIFDLLEQPRSPWAACNIHPGKANREERLLQTLAGLAPEIKSRLTLENDEYSYSALMTYSICKSAGIPMVFDAHHHVINQGCKSYDDYSVAEMCSKARETWQPNENWQLVHISNGCSSFHDRRHHDYINQLPGCFKNVEWIEVEAKKKDLAIQKLKKIISA